MAFGDSIHLDGAETVSNAARTMRAASEEMSRAAMTIDCSVDRLRTFMDDWLQRFEAAVEKLPPPKAEAKRCGDHVLGSKGDKCFDCFAHNEGIGDGKPD
jgi:hypothetical protein